MKNPGRPFLIVIMVLVILAVGFVYYIGKASTDLSSAASAIQGLRSQQTILEGQLSSANSQVASLQSQLSADKSLLSAAQSQLTTANALADSLKSELAASKSQAATLQSDVSKYKTQVSSLQDDVSAYKSQVSALQGQLLVANSANITDLLTQVSTLRAQNQDLAEIVNLSRVSLKVDTAAINQVLQDHPYDVVTFAAPYAGYLVVAGQGNSPDAYIYVTDSWPGYPLNDYHYPFGLGASLVIPVLPGNITVYYSHTNPNAVSSATISVRYYY